MRLPYARTSWLDETAIVRAVVPLLGATLAGATVHHVVPPALLHARATQGLRSELLDDVVLTASTALLSWLLARHALRARTLGQALARCLVVAPFAGALNAGLSLATMGAFAGNPMAVFFGITLGTAMGSIFGAPLGLGFGLLFTPLVGLAHHERQRPSHEGPDWVLGYGGVWMLLVGLFVLLLEPVSRLAHPLGAASALGGAAAMLVAGARLVLRSAFLRRVAAGQSPGFALVEPSSPPPPGVLPVVNDGPTPARWLVIVRREQHQPEGYRSASAELPLALVAEP